MNRNVLERVVLPIGIPLAALVLIEIAVISFSRVLLASNKTVAAVAALAAALGILVGATLVSASPRLRTSSIIGLVVLAFAGVVAAGAWGAQAGYAPLEGEHAEEEEAPAGGEAEEGALTITAVNIEFDTEELHIPAGEETSLTLVNEDAGVPHNVSIYTDDSASEAVFEGELFNGVDEMTYELPAMEPGEYYFQCDVHPNMNGTVIVE